LSIRNVVYSVRFVTHIRTNIVAHNRHIKNQTDDNWLSFHANDNKYMRYTFN